MLKSNLLIFTLIISYIAHAQQAKLVRIIASYDTTAVAELYNQTAIGLQFVYSDSSTQRTTGFLQGNYRWNKLKITTDNGDIQNGFLHFNRQQLEKANYRIILTVTTEGNVPIHTTLTLPYVIGIRFNHYADSIKRDIRYYINVEGIFSSNKIFPLDTTAVRFAASTGKIVGQDLLLDKSDTSKTVTVEAWYKPKNSLYLLSVIPVKQAADKDTLINNNSRQLHKKQHWP